MSIFLTNIFVCWYDVIQAIMSQEKKNFKSYNIIQSYTIYICTLSRYEISPLIQWPKFLDAEKRRSTHGTLVCPMVYLSWFVISFHI